MIRWLIILACAIVPVVSYIVGVKVGHKSGEEAAEKEIGRVSAAYYDKGFSAGKEQGARDEKRRAETSPYARDWPHKGPIEVLTIPCEAVTLCCEYIATRDQVDKEGLLKDRVLADMYRDLFAQAVQFIDVRIDDDPLLYGTRFLGRLVVYKRGQ
jgi:hypothetical protein